MKCLESLEVDEVSASYMIIGTFLRFKLRIVRTGHRRDEKDSRKTRTNHGQQNPLIDKAN